MVSPDTIDHLLRGAFPGRVDPFAEAGRYFQQIHSGMIEQLLMQIQVPLLQLGYYAGKETSLQIMEGRQPDLAVTHPYAHAHQGWDYAGAAAAAHTEVGVLLDAPEFQALVVKDADGELVTIIEIISPSKKDHADAMEAYRTRRYRVIREQGVNVVEIDATRSLRRVLPDTMTPPHAYHIAVYLPGAYPHFIASDFDQPLKRFALPLRGQVLAVETQAAYDQAYRTAAIAQQILHEGGYVESGIPCPSKLTSEQRASALDAVNRWKLALDRLQKSTTE